MKQKNIVLMVVAVGCGLVAAFLTSRMSAKSHDDMEVVVAAKDIPVGTLLTRDDLKATVKIVKRPKEGLPPTVVLNPEDLVEKRLSRAIRAEEPINSQDLTKGGVVTLPPGHHMVALQVGASNAVAGFVGPGSRVNVNATVRMGNRLESIALLENMLIVAVDTQTQFPKEGAFPTLSTVSLAVIEEEARLLALAKSRGCSLELMLRNQEEKSAQMTADERKERVKKMVQKLSEEKETAKLDDKGAGGSTDNEARRPEPVPPVTPAANPPAPAATPMGTPSAPADVKPAEAATVKVRVAKANIAPNTPLTTDLINDLFEEKELPKELVADAVRDLYQQRGKVLKNGVTKGFWVTPDMIDFYSSKDEGQSTQKPTPDAAPARPAPAKRNFHDVFVHSPSGTVVHRYEEVAPGQWKKVAELTAEQAARPAEAPKAPAAPEGDKKVD